jgi:hypothetical protein
VEERLHFEPRDRLLFLHHGSNRVFEGWVSDVDRQYTLVRINIPLPRRPQTMYRNAQQHSHPHPHPHPQDQDDVQVSKKRRKGGTPRDQLLCVQLDNYRNFKDYELIFLFRPGFPQLHAPPGFYLNFVTTDLWLDVDDVIEIVKQGSIVQKRTDTFQPQTFAARVTSVNDITCRIIPINAPTPPFTSAPNNNANENNDNTINTINNNNNNNSNNNSNSSNRSMVNASGISSTAQLIALESASGLAPEWVSRNTLRFRGFIKKSSLRKNSLHFNLVPSNVQPS